VLRRPAPQLQVPLVARPRFEPAVVASKTYYAGLMLWVSKSPSGRYWELHEVAAVGDPTHLVQIGRRQRLSIGEGQWRAAVQ